MVVVTEHSSKLITVLAAGGFVMMSRLMSEYVKFTWWCTGVSSIPGAHWDNAAGL